MSLSKILASKMSRKIDVPKMSQNLSFGLPRLRKRFSRFQAISKSPVIRRTQNSQKTAPTNLLQSETHGISLGALHNVIWPEELWSRQVRKCLLRLIFTFHLNSETNCFKLCFSRLDKRQLIEQTGRAFTSLASISWYRLPCLLHIYTGTCRPVHLSR